MDKKQPKEKSRGQGKTGIYPAYTLAQDYI